MRLLKLILFIVSINFLFPHNINLEKANIVANSLFEDRLENLIIRNTEIVRCAKGLACENDALFYIFHLAPTGFVIVSGDDRVAPILGYSFDNEFKSQGLPENISGLYNYYINAITFIKTDENSSLTTEIEWDTYLSENPVFDDTRNVNPLLDAEFDQSGNWNNLVQSEIGFNAPVGCVAVAMAQVMHYWGHPYTGEGQNSYTDNGTFLTANFANTYYDFDNMPATYPSTAAQLLLLHTGISVNMDYDNSGSGAWVLGGYPSTEYSMEYYFKYSSDIYHMYKTSSNSSQFLTAIKDQLEDNKPVIMVGYGSDYGGGHAWNIDGYQGNNLHCNWGWGGYSNGYFNLTTMGGFPDDQSILLDVIPRDIEDPIALYEYIVDASTVTFIDLSAEINEYEIRSWYWNFGDGNTDITTTGMIDHTYALTGTYDVELTVENIYGMMSEPFVENIAVVAAEPGDLNQDGTLDILDVVQMINFVLGGETPSESDLFIGDLNQDGIINIQDIILLVNSVLNN